MAFLWEPCVCRQARRVLKEPEDSQHELGLGVSRW